MGCSGSASLKDDAFNKMIESSKQESTEAQNRIDQYQNQIDDYEQQIDDLLYNRRKGKLVILLTEVANSH